MSGRKKSTLPGLQESFDSIKDLLSTTKPKLEDPSVRNSLIQDLHQVASLAELFTEQRPRSNKNWIHLADALDQEGVNLWNISGLIRESPKDDGRALVAARKLNSVEHSVFFFPWPWAHCGSRPVFSGVIVRLAGFRLVQAGLEAKPGIETLLHILQLASKTAATLSESGDNDAAGSVLTCAAKFEESLRNTDDAKDHRQAKACATVVYYSSRMEAAWREGKYDVAELMSHKITDDDQRFALLPPHDRTLLVSKIYDIGKSILKGDSPQGPRADSARAHDSVRWLQKAYAMIERLSDSAASGIAELQISILRTLARAYFLSSTLDPENLSRAEAALQELLPSIDSSPDHTSSEYQELRWQRLAVMKRRKAKPEDLLSAFKSIIDHMQFSEATLTDLLQELRTFTQQHVLVIAVNHHCLQQALVVHRGSDDYVDRLLLSLIFHCSKDEDHARAMNGLESAFQSIHEAGFELSSVPTTACLTLIWQYGGRYYHEKKWQEAADWYLLGSHRIFHASSPTSSAKCFRKAALCHIEQRQYAMASAVIRRCPTNEAATHYVMLLAAVHQGLEGEAVQAVTDMTNSLDFDRKMLLLATQLSHDSDMKTLLLSVLEMLLKTLKLGNSGETVTEAMTLIRCIIRLILKLLAEPGANQGVLIDTLVERFLTAKTLVDASVAQNAISMVMKDISWLWRTAYNTAVQGCSVWENRENRISELFEISRDLLEAYCEASPADVDGDLYMHNINASFSAVSGRVFDTRNSTAEKGSNEGKRLHGIAADIRTCRDRIHKLVGKNKITDANDLLRAQSFLHILRLFEAELCSQLKDWLRLQAIIEEVPHADALAVATFEAIADILWAEKDCPTNVLYKSLEAILHASIKHSALSVEKFSRWLRAICTIILSRDTVVDRTTAISYVEQAITVIENSSEGDEAYPMDERQWLLGTAYNTGMECVHASHFDEAKRWFECSTVICRFIPDGKHRAERISEQYMQLLARYTRT